MPRRATAAGAVSIVLRPVNVGPARAAKICGLSRRQWDALTAAGKVPAPMRHLGRRLLWSVAELEAWSAAGCPPRVEWEERKRLAQPAARGTLPAAARETRNGQRV